MSIQTAPDTPGTEALHVVFPDYPGDSILKDFSDEGFVVRRNMRGQIECYGRGKREEVEKMAEPANGNVAPATI